MAVNKSAKNKIKTEAGLTEALAYITNPAKISEVSRINCSGSNSNTLDQFKLMRLAFDQNKGIIAHHFVQSFAPNDNVTPEIVHRFGVEYAKLCFPNYQVVVSTHVDKDHLHNHIIVNSCNMITGKKFYDNKETMNNNRAISDKLCCKYGVSVISTQSEFKPIDQTTMQLALKQKSWKIQLLSDLDEAKEKCRSKSEFISFFKSRNYEIRYEKHITIRKIGEKKAIRVDTLAKQFGKDGNYHDMAVPLNDRFRQLLKEKVLSEYGLLSTQILCGNMNHAELTAEGEVAYKLFKNNSIAQKVINQLSEHNIKYSAKINARETTICFLKSDFETMREISLKAASETENHKKL